MLFDSVLDELKGCWGSNQKIGFSFSFSTLSDAIIEPEPVQCSGETEIFIDIIYSPRSSRPFNCHQKRTFVLCVSFTVSDSVFLSLSSLSSGSLSPFNSALLGSSEVIQLSLTKSDVGLFD